MRAILFNKEGVQGGTAQCFLAVENDTEFVIKAKAEEIKMPFDLMDDIKVQEVRYNLTNIINGVGFFKEEDHN